MISYNKRKEEDVKVCTDHFPPTIFKLYVISFSPLLNTSGSQSQINEANKIIFHLL